MTDPYAAVPYDDDLPVVPPPSPRSRGVALCLGALLGFFGAHRFYAGRVQSGIYQLLTLGGLGIWWCYDLILLAAGEFTDAQGRRIRNWGVEEAAPGGAAGAHEVARLGHEVELLRGEISELAERVDFAERLLAQRRDPGKLAP